MIIAWIGYCLLVSALLGLAALATERALGHYRRPVRAVWTAALAGSVILPVAAYVAPALVSRFATVTPMLPGGFSSTIELAGLSAAAGPGGFDWAGFAATTGVVLGALWVISIVGFGAHLFVTHRRLRREMTQWTSGEILDAPVLLSPDRGPAVVGVGRGVIVMPAWIAELEEDVLRLVFLHEREHQRAGDHRLFSLGLLGVIAMPWNPFAWWQLRRLRLAIEYDCDRRVMAQGVSPREYAEALLAVGSRLTAPPLAAAAFAERRPAVERRLRRMTEPLRRLRGPRAVFAVGVSTLAVLFACNSPLPVETPLDASTEVAPEATDVTFGEVKPAGTMTRRDQAIAPGVGSDPLIVIDGVIQADGLDKEILNELDIEKVEVIKGAAAESMYGSRARDGAVQVTTKNGSTIDPTWSGSGGRFEVRDLDADGRLDVIHERESKITPSSGPPTDAPRPLIVIDEVVQSPSAELSDLDKGDIAHVEVIKGEEALRLYGDRGRNGVVLITTKGGSGS